MMVRLLCVFLLYHIDGGAGGRRIQYIALYQYRDSVVCDSKDHEPPVCTYVRIYLVQYGMVQVLVW